MIAILYEDRHLVVCVKPAGVLSQDAGENSLPGLLRAQLGTDYVGVVHRLDREVGGVMVYAKTPGAAAALSRSVQERTLEKTYLAVLRGIPEASAGTLEDLLFHDQNRNKTYVVDRMRKGVKEAELEYTVIGCVNDSSLLRIRLHTGRSHQIRVQFASRAMPLLGDARYGSKTRNCGIALWSESLCFPHPFAEKTMDFRQAPPEVFPWTEFPANFFAD